MLLIEIIKAIIFGIVEGITEWLPISSTGHLILVEEFIKFKDANAPFTNMFNVVIQLGAILAVVVIYFDRLNPFKKGKTVREVQLTWQLWLKVIIAALPAAIIGLKINDWLDAHFQNFFTVALMLIIYGVAFIYVEKRHENIEPVITRLADMPYKTAIYIGLFQVLSLIPGTSRSGATILGGILVGTSREVATEFTFFLGIPIMFGASLYKIFKFIKSGTVLMGSQLLILLVAMLVAFVVSLYVIRFLTDYVKNHDFTFFGKYRIGLGTLLIMYGLITAVFG
ncbi:undecaprenyl-diphosphate phosphatase [Streptococcus ratti]|uniref:Undecaprenyl-diphosphatase n=2 Tax=Streptococcus ratti TaxID=1341 RepID=A0A7X9LD83_STRRT|nr:undecaprenyl-diphosphate phosphatase [Streptococcus ratti]VEI59276.1 undecaprenyl pyrophosphate phosphatase [Streptococcus mutans]EJN93167.1 undecaprenyl pyrophosphate phosphatase [Streptococcus ratti FA-1 = DSM 20564]EMP70103.1 undecaprenyl pyrophosphate phosphatase [Streptococcus ratti FA-1 = DSM 20564]NMD48782.1 undecaprenyl-diphosphate phosphatase [Streptococcus ratti]QEY06859.1 undecaprenyl-diphosphate phosphatase [Streptococcus ratti]